MPEPFKQIREDATSALQRVTSERIRIGLGIAAILSHAPKTAHATIIKSMAPIIQKAGYEPFSWTEATLLARLATENAHLKDPSQVDANDPKIQRVNRELNDIFRGLNQRAHMRSFDS